MNSTPRDRLVAVITAVALHLVVLLSFCYTYLTWPPKDMPEEPEEDSEILFVNDYINLGDMLTDRHPADAPEAPSAGEQISDAVDMVNSGEPATPAPVKTSERELPMKVAKKPAPEKKGPTKEELEAQERERREQASRDKIKKQMNFGGSGSGNGVSGNAEGDAVSGMIDGKAGHDLAGRTILSWGANRSNKSGSIQVRVSVNAAGHVTEARYIGGTGPASGDASIRNRTVAATRQTRFSPLPEGETKIQKGVITWNFK